MDSILSICNNCYDNGHSSGTYVCSDGSDFFGAGTNQESFVSLFRTTLSHAVMTDLHNISVCTFLLILER